MGFPRYFWHFFLIPGLLLLAGALFDAYKTWDAQRLIAHSQGTVVRTLAGGKLGLDFSADIQFATPDGRSHTFSSIMRSVNELRAGRKVTVVYEIDDPDHARVDMGKSHPWEGAILLSVWGGIFALLGGIPLYFRARKAKREDWLKLNGRTVQAEFAGVHLNTDLIVNGRSPYRVAAEWKDPATNQTYSFSSDNLWSDPAEHLTSKVISVVIDPGNPKRYWMDLSFLPRHR
jgi:hypothetical protein